MWKVQREADMGLDTKAKTATNTQKIRVWLSPLSAGCLLLLALVFTAHCPRALAAEGTPPGTLMLLANTAANLEESAEVAEARTIASRELWTARLQDLEALEKQTQESLALVEKQVPLLHERMTYAHESAGRLLTLYKVFDTHPAEQLAIVQKLSRLHTRLLADIVPLTVVLDVMGGRLTRLAELREDIPASKKARRQTPDNDAALFDTYAKRLAAVENQLIGGRSRIEKSLAPANTLKEKLTATVESIQASLPEIWRNYYIANITPNIADLLDVPSATVEWLSTLPTRQLFAFPSTAPDQWPLLRACAIVWAGMIFLGIAMFRSAAFLPDNWRTGLQKIARTSWVWLSIGLSLIVAAGDSRDGLYVPLVLLGALTLIWGIADLSWKLRFAAHGELAGKPLPLGRLYPPAALGVFTLYADMPQPLVGMVWTCLMVSFTLTVRYINKHRKNEDTGLPLLERLLYSCSFYFGIISFLVCVSGYTRMAILLFMALFALANTLTLGRSLAELAHVIANVFLPPESRPVVNALAKTASTPLVWVLSLVCTLPWLWAVPGAEYMLRYVMDQGYTIGTASLDSWRLLVIVAAFFLVRSLVNLGHIALEHLPDRMPKIERGVIPPLQTMSRYGLWVAFGGISLGTMGLNFTSLAVVAGGLSVGIGFGMQNIFNNLVSGLLLISGRSMLVGDYVEVGATAGTVVDISVRSTTIRTAEQALVYVPNSAFMSAPFVNWTRDSRQIRRTINVGVAYGSDVALVEKLLLEVANRHKNVLTRPVPFARLTEFGPSSLDFSLFIFINDIDNATGTMSDIRLGIKTALEEHGIEIPFPKMDVNFLPTTATANAKLPPVSTVSGTEPL